MKGLWRGWRVHWGVSVYLQWRSPRPLLQACEECCSTETNTLLHVTRTCISVSQCSWFKELCINNSGKKKNCPWQIAKGNSVSSLFFYWVLCKVHEGIPKLFSLSFLSLSLQLMLFSSFWAANVPWEIYSLTWQKRQLYSRNGMVCCNKLQVSFSCSAQEAALMQLATAG